MHASELEPARRAGLPAPSATPVICDTCRAEGTAGDPLFEAIPDILGFTPVPRRAHANGWSPEHQRAFIAALALTGSPRQAARTIGRHAFGAEQLRTARGGQSFAEAWGAAMELAREREFRRIHANLADLSQDDEATFAPVPREGAAPVHPDGPYDPDAHEEDYPAYWESLAHIRQRLVNCRRLYLASIAADADKRAAFETLAGPVDWPAAATLQAQPGEIPMDPNDPESGLPNMRDPAMVLAVEDGWLPDVAGGPTNPTLLFFQALGKAGDELTGEEKDAIAAHIDQLVAAGWTQRPDGSWHKADEKPRPPATPPAARIRTFD